MMSLDFNSIKVRLEHITFDYKEHYLNGFQFHKGAIRTYCEEMESHSLFYFNSIKVRLEQSIDDTFKHVVLFQFHKGAIRTKAGRLLAKWNVHFNSIKVRLEHIWIVARNRKNLISIP